MDNEQIIWITLMIVFLIVEGLSIGLTSIWFALGALVALVLSLVSAPLWLQIVLFFVVSIVAIVFTRPLAQKYVNSRVKHTNADSVIGAAATVTERIDNIAGTGMATVGGRLWTARSAVGDIIEAGTLTKVTEIKGVKILVIPYSGNSSEE